jgi:adenylylsulfate kinase
MYSKLLFKMFIVQMTGLSGAGKSTLASALKVDLNTINIAAEVIDADVYRNTICSDLGFSATDRRENIRRLASIASSLQKKGVLAIIAAINPFEDVRAEVRKYFNAKTIWVHCNLDTLIRRDPKGLYKKALLPDGDPEKIWNLSGINDTYEVPQEFELVIDTGESDFESARQKLFAYVLTQIDSYKLKSFVYFKPRVI